MLDLYNQKVYKEGFSLTITARYDDGNKLIYEEDKTYMDS